ncbi:hypothetical protein SAMN05216420_104249 [Nitrosospira sp. Nl5]|uniref:hypothetical protein n=1 Tax=Nitrosospira sp. Nl5 TaxID=200120 RepID=UPI000889FC82|nr:hypothetical protein [Nitrosospira sp. Nl5]SCY32473.1 hypothetical protein SAMN05216420_104249 [Nitrosospira sp. Nl5]
MNQVQTKITSLHAAPSVSHSYMEDFIKTYESLFMDPGKREDSENPASLPRVEKIAIAFDQELRQGSQVAVGLVLKHYDKESSGLLAYFAVAANYQRNQIAIDMMSHASALAKKIQEGEIPIPSEMTEQQKLSSSNPAEKDLAQASLLSNLPVKKVDISYSQPGSIGEQKTFEHLILLYFPIRQDSQPVNGTRVAEFLLEFYKAHDANFIEMKCWLRKQARRVILPESGYEKPKLSKESLKRTSICFHFVERKVSIGNRFDHDDVFGSMERDLLKYQFQADPPLDSTHCFGNGKLEIVFPPSFHFRSEGRYVELISTQRPRAVNFMLNKTEFQKSGIRIWHLTLSTNDNDPLNEFEIIKLISLYDGRSEDTGPYTELASNQSPKLAHRIGFNYRGKENLSINSLIVELIPAEKTEQKKLTRQIALNSGTVQILLVEDEKRKNMDLLRKAIKARSDDAAHKEILREMKEDTFEKQVLQALSGIAIGIFDFQETDNEEILDTFDPSFSDASIFIKFNRCTLLSIVTEDRAWDSCRATVGISPYLIIPHAVIIHNEELVKMAEEKIDRLDVERARRLLKLGRLEADYAEADRYLHSLYLPMIFNYPTEQALFNKGNENRGSTEKYKIMQFKLRELHIQIESLRQTTRSLGQSLLSVILALITALHVFDYLAIIQVILFIPILLLGLVALGLPLLGKLTFNPRSKIR